MKVPHLLLSDFNMIYSREHALNVSNFQIVLRLHFFSLSSNTWLLCLPHGPSSDSLTNVNFMLLAIVFHDN